MVKLPPEFWVTDFARSRSNPIAIGVEPTLMGLLNVTVPVIGPEIVFCVAVFVAGSIYMTVAEPMVTVAPV